ncbi:MULTISPECIES: hypothetical protein [Bacillus]|uniref:hypothetical protein n=1 Tax=Bacillus TaxID=1386 RepID=UPI0002F050C0|nr:MULTISPECIES: hypothetical protein [Bacillus]
MKVSNGVLTVDFKDLHVIRIGVQTGAGIEAGVKTLFLLNGQDTTSIEHIELTPEAKGQEFAEAALKAIEAHVKTNKLH